MTREEIIEHLDSIVGTYEILLGHGVNSDVLDVDDIEAIKEAISALSENKGDLISRQAVEDITWEEPSYSDPLNVLTEVREKVRALPSAENKGEWIPVTERLPEDSQRVNITIQRSHTVYVTTATWDEMRGYFYNLGHAFDDVVAWRELPEPYKADMRGEQNEHD